MHKILNVAWREFRHTALTKAFFFGAVIMPILMIGLFIIMGQIEKQSSIKPLKGTIAVIAPDDIQVEFKKQLFEKVAKARSTTEADQEVLKLLEGDYAEFEDLKSQVREGKLTALIVVPDAIVQEFKTEQIRDDAPTGLLVVPDAIVQEFKTEKVKYEKLNVFVHSNLSHSHTGILKDVVSKSVVDVRIRRLGQDPNAIRKLLRTDATAIRLSEDGGEVADNELKRLIVPIAFMILLWMATFTSGQYLLTTTIEEKSNKVMEVLLSAISPMQLLAGKILGQAGVSAVILGMYGSTVIAAVVAFSLLNSVPPSHLVFLGVFFIMAYFMIATIMVAIGSAVSELSDAQSLMGPVMLVLMIPMALLPIITKDPNGTIATVTSFIPPLIPFTMILRVTAATEPVAMWQIVLSIGAGFIAVIVMVWMSARIFRIGLLMQGKPPSVIQLIRWIRQG